MPLPRLARLDAPGILHHVIGRGIERKKIFFNNTDRSDFIDRLTDLAEQGAMDVYAWVLMPNHFHILCKAHNRALSSSFIFFWPKSLSPQKLSGICPKRGGIGTTSGTGWWWIGQKSGGLVGNIST